MSLEQGWNAKVGEEGGRAGDGEEAVIAASTEHSGSAARHQVHVLVAEDEPHIGRIIKTKLEQGPFRVSLVYDGTEALEVLRQASDIALVLLDLMMPRMSGLEVLAQMRSDPRWSAIPCIILTAAGQEQQQRRAMELRASDFITKPFSPRKLYARVAELAGITGAG